MPQIGRQQYFGHAKEGTRLTAESAPTDFLPFTEMTLQPIVEYYQNAASINTRHQLFSQEVANVSSSGNLAGHINASNISDALYYFMGSVASVEEITGTGGAWKNTFTLLDSTQLPTFTAFYSMPEIGNLKARGVTLNQSLEISIAAAAENATYNAAVMGIVEEANGVAPTPVYTKPEMFLFGRHFTLSFADTIAGLASPTQVAEVTSATLTLNNNGERKDAIGSVNPVDNRAGEFTAELSFTAVVDSASSAFDGFFKNGTKKAIRLKGENTGADQLGTANDTGIYPMVRFDLAPSLINITYSKALETEITFDATVTVEYSVSDGFKVLPYVQNNENVETKFA